MNHMDLVFVICANSRAPEPGSLHMNGRDTLVKCIFHGGHKGLPRRVRKSRSAAPVWLRIGPRLPASVDPAPILAGGAAAGAEAFDDLDLAVVVEVRPGRDLVGGTPTTEAETGFGIEVAYPDARRRKVETIAHGPAPLSSIYAAATRPWRRASVKPHAKAGRGGARARQNVVNRKVGVAQR